MLGIFLPISYVAYFVKMLNNIQSHITRQPCGDVIQTFQRKGMLCLQCKQAVCNSINTNIAAFSSTKLLTSAVE